jgi:hypothetical protein
MNNKIFRICPLYTNSEIFRAEHGLEQKPFADQIKLLQSQGMIIPGGWTRATEAEGFSVFETVYDDTALQTQWCKENSPGILSLANTGLDIRFEILKEQVRAFQPDIIFVYAHALMLVPAPRRRELCSVLGKKVLLTGFWGDELPKQYYQNFKDLDFVFCSSAVYERRFIEWARIPSETIGNCFDDAVHFEPPEGKQYDFIFCGRTGYGLAQHVSRYNKLVEIANRTNLRIWGWEPNPVSILRKEAILAVLARLPTSILTISKRIVFWAPHYLGERRLFKKASAAFDRALSQKAEMSKTVTSSIIENSASADASRQRKYWRTKKSLRKLFPSRFNPLLTGGSDYYRLLAESRIVLNLHRTEDADIGNVRCFEVTGVGSCLITDRREGLREFFDVDNDIVTFETAKECVDRVTFLLSHPDEIERIARNGQRTTLSRHTARHRAKTIADRHKQLFAAKPDQALDNPPRPSIVHAIYDGDKNPISYDVAFFLQAAQIFRKLSGATGLIISIVWPKDISDIPGLPRRYNLAVDADAKAFRIFHILAQMAERVTSQLVFQIKDRKLIDKPLEFARGAKVVAFPQPNNTHHSIYYRLVNDNPKLMEGFSASQAARRYVDDWLRSASSCSKKVLCITLRQYAYDPQRNSNMPAWEAFLSRIDPKEFSVVIVPDTDQFAGTPPPFGGKYPAFTPACFDIDLRFALYEQAYLNMFVNNGPGSAATLSRKIKYIMFKLIVPGVPHCSAESLMQLGFEPGKSPKYANEFQKWVWTDDDTETLWMEFCTMKEKIESQLTAC